ncbi:MAG: NUDIX hydrolase [Parachlamydiaceae bacterium]|nr:NUDIX hydrolase [Parachlamydiaceae bacterium]
MPYTYEYPHFALTVDAILLNNADQSIKVLLIRRAKDPFKDCWAFPGGYVDIDEIVEDAVHRELAEETNVSNVALKRFDIFDAIDRDPRERTVSVAYYGFINDSVDSIRAGDDAKEAMWFSVNDLPKLAFDHAIILEKLLSTLKNT